MFLGHALLEIDDELAVPTLAQARRQGESRGELWWMPETIRLEGLAERRFGDEARAVALLDEAEALATRPAPACAAANRRQPLSNGGSQGCKRAATGRQAT